MHLGVQECHFQAFDQQLFQKLDFESQLRNSNPPKTNKTSAHIDMHNGDDDDDLIQDEIDLEDCLLVSECNKSPSYDNVETDYSEEPKLNINNCIS